MERIARLSSMLFIAISLAACGDDEDADEPEAVSCEQCTLAVQLDRLKASDAVNCRFAPSADFDPGVLADAAVASQDAYDCVSAALEEDRPFVFVLDQLGTDSTVQMAWVVDDEGVVHELDYDSHICGGSGCTPGCGPSVSHRICEDARVTGPNQPLVCADTGDRDVVCAPDSYGTHVSGD